MVHEIGHYLLGLYDEYITASGTNINGDYGLIDDQYGDPKNLEMSKQHDYTNVNLNNCTAQYSNHRLSCEDYVANRLQNGYATMTFNNYSSEYTKSSADRFASYKEAEENVKFYNIVPVEPKRVLFAANNDSLTDNNVETTNKLIGEIYVSEDNNKLTISLETESTFPINMVIKSLSDSLTIEPILTKTSNGYSTTIDITGDNRYKIIIEEDKGLGLINSNTIYVDRMNNIESGCFFDSFGHKVIAYLLPSNNVNVNFVSYESPFVNGEYESLNQVTYVGTDKEVSYEAGELYSVVDIDDNIDYSSMSWFKKQGETWKKLDTTLTMEDAVNIGARCNFDGNGTYALMGKKASSQKLSLIKNLSYTTDNIKDGIVQLTFDDPNTDVNHYEIYVSEIPFATTEGINKYVKLPGETNYMLDLGEVNHTYYVGIIAVGENGSKSELSEIKKVITAEVDSDNDGIPDWYCDKYMLWDSNSNKPIAECDKDNDGHSNLNEYLNGTNPLDMLDPVMQPIIGDVNNDRLLSSADASLILLYSVGKTVFSDDQIEIADVNNDGLINSSDAVAILVSVNGSNPIVSTNNTAELEIETAYAPKNEIISVPISISENSNAYATEFEILYDANLLEYVTANRSSMFDLEQINHLDGKIKLAFASATPINEAGIIANITFKVKESEEKSAALIFDNSYVITINKDFNYSNVSTNLINGFIVSSESILIKTDNHGYINDKTISAISGDSFCIYATMYPELIGEFKWTSSNSNVATINETGKLTTHSEGTAYIMVTSDQAMLSAGFVIQVSMNDICSIQGHTLGDWEIVSPAMCESTGEEYRKCSTCDYSETQQISALGHTEEVLPSLNPTCTTTGLTEGKKCSVCGKITVEQTVVSATGHTEEVIPAVAATCTETGLTEGKKCTVCGEILVVQEEIPALGHIDADADGLCDNCGESLAAAFTPGDVNGDGEITSTDARTTLRAAVGLDELNETQFKAADVIKDNEITSADARSILRCAVGLETF